MSGKVQVVEPETGLIKVTLPSGGDFSVHEREVDHFRQVSNLYTTQHRFTDISDRQDLDRLLILETLCYRWGSWLARERDWENEPIDTQGTVKWLNDASGELRQLKKIIGIDKASRDRTRGEDSVSEYLVNLRQRAKEFGVSRNEMAVKSITLFHDLQKLVTLWSNTDAQEQKELHCTMEDVFDWITQIAIPEFEAIDKAFRETTQKYWIRKQ